MCNRFVVWVATCLIIALRAHPIIVWPILDALVSLLFRCSKKTLALQEQQKQYRKKEKKRKNKRIRVTEPGKAHKRPYEEIAIIFFVLAAPVTWRLDEGKSQQDRHLFKQYLRSPSRSLSVALSDGRYAFVVRPSARDTRRDRVPCLGSGQRAVVEVDMLDDARHSRPHRVSS
jgi:hypothetical protein